MSSQKYYVVWKGLKPGIYTNWEEAKVQITNYNGAKYKSFKTIAEAEVAFKSNPEDFIGKNDNTASKISRANLIEKQSIIENSICVDAACSGNPGDLEYRGVETISGKEIFRKGPYKMGTNNIGEYLAIVHAAALLKKHKSFETVIYSDSLTAIKWIKDKYPKTKLQSTDENKPIFELLERANSWLNENDIKNPIVHWQTEEWGEIPADFGRK